MSSNILKNMVNLSLFLFYMYIGIPHASFMMVKLNEWWFGLVIIIFCATIFLGL